MRPVKQALIDSAINLSRKITKLRDALLGFFRLEGLEDGFAVVYGCRAVGLGRAKRAFRRRLAAGGGRGRDRCGRGWLGERAKHHDAFAVLDIERVLGGDDGSAAHLFDPESAREALAD